MALQVVESGQPQSANEHFDRATLRLSQAKALIEALGTAVEYGPSEGLPAADAASGIVALLEQAHVSMYEYRQGT